MSRGEQPSGEWRRVGLREALLWARDRAIAREEAHAWAGPFEHCGCLIEFTDGSRLFAHSAWEGPWSPDTPDVDAQPPQFYLMVPPP